MLKQVADSEYGAAGGDPVDLVTFRLTGRRGAADDDEAVPRGLAPALFAHYRDLAQLRYDFPLVLVEGNRGGAWLRPLSGIVDDILEKIAGHDIEGERLRKQVLRLEQRIRSRVAAGGGATLTTLWRDAEAELVAAAAPATRTTLRDNLARAGRALDCDGRLIDCDAETPLAVVRHAWAADRAARARRFRARVGDLVVRLADILRADFMNSAVARSPEALRRAFGAPSDGTFDFVQMSRLLSRDTGVRSLPESRRQRVAAALATLREQRFYPLDEDGDAAAPDTAGFVFDGCAGALDAFLDRLGEMVAVVKAITIAELEIANGYSERKHDAVFEAFDARALSADDLAMFPPLLARLGAAADASEMAAAVEILSSALPIRIVVGCDDLAAAAGLEAGRFPAATTGPRLARMALGLGDAFVVQASAAQLLPMADAVRRGCAHDGPTLFSVFAGALAGTAAPPPYLAAAAATESRAFPSFVLDPGGGGDWAARFSIAANPQPEADWPCHDFAFEAEERRRTVETLAFSFVDFVACDGRYAGHFRPLARADWPPAMVPAAEVVASAGDEAAEQFPYVLMVDGDDALFRVVVEDGVIEAARRCRRAWRDLQELGGIHNSHAERQLALARERWQAEQAAAVPAAPAAPTVVPVAAPAAEIAVVAEPEPEPAKAAPGAPYVETARCTTCHECIHINDRMFAYDANQQAYIVDAAAGSFRELVEAAESCQVAIIHPGKPLNPNEANLDELIKRAELFN
jgi:hypothetical protein